MSALEALPLKLRNRVLRDAPWNAASDVFHHFLKAEKALAPAVRRVRAHVKKLGYGEGELPDAQNFLNTWRFLLRTRSPKTFPFARKHAAALARVVKRLNDLRDELPQQGTPHADPNLSAARQAALDQELKTLAAVAGAVHRPPRAMTRVRS